MITYLNAMTQNLSAFLWPVMWQVGLFIILLECLFHLSKKASPFFRYGLWLLVLVRLLLPFPFSSPYSVTNSFQPVVVQMTAAFPPANPSTAVAPMPPLSNTISETMPAVPSVISPYQVRVEKLSISSFVFIFWLMGIAVFSTLIVWHALHIRKKIRQCPLVDDVSLLNLFHELCSLMGIKQHIKLHSLSSEEHDGGPRIAGLLHPAVYLPEAMIRNWKQEDLKPVLLHELAHIRQYDPFTNWLQIILQVLYFFHPLVWFANYRVRQMREEVCDAVALRYLQGGQGDYSRSILRVIEESQNRRFLLLDIGFTETRHTLKSRILNIMRIKNPLQAKLKYTTVLGILCVALLSFVFAAEKTKSQKDVTAVSDNKNIIPLEYGALDYTHPVAFTCLDVDGKPVAGAEVYAQIMVQTKNEDQKYKLKTLGPEYSDKNGQAAFPKFLLNNLYEEPHNAFAFVPGKLVCMWASENRTLILKKTASLQVTVSIPAGFSLEKTIVSLESLDGRVFFGKMDETENIQAKFYTAKANVRGNFVINNIPESCSLYVAAYGEGLTKITNQIQFSPDNNATSFTLQPGGSVAGRVTDLDGNPLPNFTVRCMTNSLRTTSASTVKDGGYTKTNRQGEFIFEYLMPTIYQIRASVPGYVPSQIVTIDLKPGMHSRDLHLVAQKGIPVSGTVKTETGEALPLASVSAYQINGSTSPINYTYTDDAGNFAIQLPPGKIEIQIAEARYVKNFVDAPLLKQIIEVAPEQKELNLNLQVPSHRQTVPQLDINTNAAPVPQIQDELLGIPVRTITCVDDKNQPVKGAEVSMIYGLKTENGFSLNHRIGPMQTDDNGICRFPMNQFIGKFYGMKPHLAILPGQKIGIESGSKITLFDTTQLEGRVSVPEGSQPEKTVIYITSISIYNPQTNYDQTFNATEVAINDIIAMGLYTTVKPDGTFTISNIPKFGKVTLQATAPGLAPKQWFTVDTSKIEKIEFALQLDTSIQGKVTFESGEPAVGVSVRAVPHPTFKTGDIPQQKTLTNEIGAYQFNNLQPVSYTLTAETVASNPIPMNQMPEWVCPAVTGIKTEAGKQVKDINLVLQKGAIVSGKVVFSETAFEVPGASLVAVSPEEERVQYGFVITDPHGNYSFRLPQGRTKFYFSSLPWGYFDPKNWEGNFIEVKPGQKEIKDFNFTLVAGPRFNDHKPFDPPKEVIAERTQKLVDSLQPKRPVRPPTMFEGNEVSYYCLDDEENPIEGAEVYAYLYKNSPNDDWSNMKKEIIGPVYSGKNGLCKFPNRIKTKEFDGMHILFAHVPGKWAAAGEEDPGDKIYLKPSQTLKGKITVPEGYDLRKVAIEVIQASYLNSKVDSNKQGELFRYSHWSPKLLDPQGKLKKYYATVAGLDGSFALPSLPAYGIVSLSLKCPGLAEERIKIKTPVQDALSITMKIEATLEGTIRYADGKPAGNIPLVIWYSNETESYKYTATSTADGNFSYRGLPVDEPLTVWAVPDSASGLVSSLITTATPESGQILKGNNLQLTKGCLVKGRVVKYGTSEGIPNVKIKAQTPDNNNISYPIRKTETDAEGNYELLLGSGKYQIYMLNDTLPAYDIAPDAKQIQVPEDKDAFSIREFRLRMNTPLW